MRLHLAYDHAGFDLADHLRDRLTRRGHVVIDHGPRSYDPQDDYPDFCTAAARATVNDIESRVQALGIVIGGSGNGEQIAANKVPGVRAALVWNVRTARFAREHNDANVLAVGAREHSHDNALRLVEEFLTRPFSEDARHSRRIARLHELERGFVGLGR